MIGKNLRSFKVVDYWKGLHLKMTDGERPSRHAATKRAMQDGCPHHLVLSALSAIDALSALSALSAPVPSVPFPNDVPYSKSSFQSHHKPIMLGRPAP